MPISHEGMLSLSGTSGEEMRSLHCVTANGGMRSGLVCRIGTRFSAGVLVDPVLADPV